MSQVGSWYEIDNKEEVKDEDNEDDKGEDGKEEVEKDDDDKAMFKAGQRCLLCFIKLLLLWDPQIAAVIPDIFHPFKSIIVFPFSLQTNHCTT